MGMGMGIECDDKSFPNKRMVTIIERLVSYKLETVIIALNVMMAMGCLMVIDKVDNMGNQKKWVLMTNAMGMDWMDLRVLEELVVIR